MKKEGDSVSSFCGEKIIRKNGKSFGVDGKKKMKEE